MVVPLHRWKTVNKVSDRSLSGLGMEYQSQGEGVQNLEHLCRVLRLMGLSNNEIRVYTTLLLNGPLTTPQLAEHLSVHRVQVYTVLRKLVSRGLVEVAQGKPMVYRAVEPEVLLEKFLSEVQNLRERALEEVRRLREVRRGTGEEVAQHQRGAALRQGRVGKGSWLQGPGLTHPVDPDA